MGGLSFFGVLRLRLARSAAPNSAQDDGLSSLYTSEELALVAGIWLFTLPAGWTAGTMGWVQNRKKFSHNQRVI
jgi:hypothetical protein